MNCNAPAAQKAGDSHDLFGQSARSMVVEQVCVCVCLFVCLCLCVVVVVVVVVAVVVLGIIYLAKIASFQMWLQSVEVLSHYLI